MNTAAMLVTDAEKANVEAAIAALPVNYAIQFSRKVCPKEPIPTWETPHTHWYMNDQSVPDEVFAAWAAAAPGLPGLKYYAATNVTDPLAWAESNMGFEGLMFLPDPEY